MARSSALVARTLTNNAMPHLSNVIGGIGTDDFGALMLSSLHQMCGADHCTMFQIGQDTLSELAAVSLDGTDTAHQKANTYINKQYWRRDPTMCEARRRDKAMGPTVIRVDVSGEMASDLRNAVYPNVRERLLICSGGTDSAFGLSVIRSDHHGRFSDADVQHLAAIADTLIAILAKHAEVSVGEPKLTMALTSLVEIERSIVTAPESLSRREAEVCARILYGLSTIGIALDLGIGEESVMTYRKRAYQRLNIGSQRELLLWYLALWGALRAHSRQARPSHQLFIGAPATRLRAPSRPDAITKRPRC